MSEIEDLIDGFNKLLKEIHAGSSLETQETSVKEKIRELNKKCTLGADKQNSILKNKEILEHLNCLMSAELVIESIPTDTYYKLLANTIVGNQEGQKIVFDKFKEKILGKLETNDSTSNVCWMIVYNTLISDSEILDQKEVLRTGLKCIESHLENNEDPVTDFLGIFLDYMICENDKIVEIYKDLEEDYQIVLLYYILDYLKNESNDNKIHNLLLKHMSQEFKNTSDCILKTVTSYVESVRPEKVVTLLEIISVACCLEKYLSLLKTDASLFLNTCIVLQNLHKIGKNSDNIFSPIQKLDSLAPSSNDNCDYEKEFSYNFKTMLIKTIANLCHQNKKNQDLAREMEIMMSIFDCTNADARNPLIKEWSILAIRNLCENNLENQEMIRSLTKVGEAESPLLKEFGIDQDVLRIGK